MGTQKEDSVETWINEEASLLAQYLRNEKQAWIARASYKYRRKSPFEGKRREQKRNLQNVFFCQNNHA